MILIEEEIRNKLLQKEMLILKAKNGNIEDYEGEINSLGIYIDHLIKQARKENKDK